MWTRDIRRFVDGATLGMGQNESGVVRETPTHGLSGLERLKTVTTSRVLVELIPQELCTHNRRLLKQTLILCEVSCRKQRTTLKTMQEQKTMYEAKTMYNAKSMLV